MLKNKEIMEINFKKQYGQNFLTDTNLLSAIVADSGVTSSDTVLEIGAGAGALTQIIAKNAKNVVSFEIDKELSDVLNKNLAAYNNVNLIFGDYLKYSADQIKELVGSNYHVVANLPYYITSPLISSFLNSENPPKSLTIMVQKEVAERICANPKTKDYGVLSIMVGLCGIPKITRIVKRQMFTPAPNVDSAIVHIDIQGVPRDYNKIIEFVKLCFFARRKTLSNNLSRNYSKQQISQAFNALNISSAIRAEELTQTDFINLYYFFAKNV